MALIICSNCGKNISDKAVKCPHCGAEVAGMPIVCSECGAKYPSDLQSCPECGCMREISPKETVQTGNSKDRKFIVIILCIILVVILGLGALAVSFFVEKKKADEIESRYNQAVSTVQRVYTQNYSSNDEAEALKAELMDAYNVFDELESYKESQTYKDKAATGINLITKDVNTSNVKLVYLHAATVCTDLELNNMSWPEGIYKIDLNVKDEEQKEEYTNPTGMISANCDFGGYAVVYISKAGVPMFALYSPEDKFGTDYENYYSPEDYPKYMIRIDPTIGVYPSVD